MGFRQSKNGRWARFFLWAGRVERGLFHLVLLGMALLVAGQIMDHENPWDSVIALTSLNNDPVLHSRELPSLPNIKGKLGDQADEGDSITGIENSQATVTLQVENFSSLAKAKVMVNGLKAADFIEKQVSVKVRHGDLLAVDGSFYQQAIKVKVLDTSPVIKRPEEGREFLIRSGITELGRVEFGKPR
ncbi:MAG: hypothetical protein ACYDG6_07255 [Thermincolia bacterium]